MTRYRRSPTETWQELAAAAAGVAVGAVVYYFARAWLQREPVPPPAGRPAARRGDAGERDGEGRRSP